MKWGIFKMIHPTVLEHYNFSEALEMGYIELIDEFDSYKEAVDDFNVNGYDEYLFVICKITENNRG